MGTRDVAEVYDGVEGRSLLLKAVCTHSDYIDLRSKAWYCMIMCIHCVENMPHQDRTQEPDSILNLLTRYNPKSRHEQNNGTNVLRVYRRLASLNTIVTPTKDQLAIIVVLLIRGKTTITIATRRKAWF